MANRARERKEKSDFYQTEFLLGVGTLTMAKFVFSVFYFSYIYLAR